MLKRTLATLLAMTTILLVLAGCQLKTNTTTNSSQSEVTYKTTTDLVQAVKKANKDLTSVHSKTDIEVYEKRIILTK